MLEVTRSADEPDEEVSLGVYNTVWPHDALTMDEVRSFKASVRDYADFLARMDGTAVGSGIGAIFPQRADRVFTMVTVLAGQRRHGAGSEDDDIEPFGDWLAHDMQGSGDRPEATFVAVAGEEVVGYAKFSLAKAQPTVAHHDLSAVKRAWRGRGVARALKAAQINWAIANGYAELHTRNEERNEPIRRLNARFGYRPGIGRIYLVGPLSGS